MKKAAYFRERRKLLRQYGLCAECGVELSESFRCKICRMNNTRRKQGLAPLVRPKDEPCSVTTLKIDRMVEIAFRTRPRMYA